MTDASAWMHEVAEGTGYLIPETGEIAPASVVVEAFKRALRVERDMWELHPEYFRD